MFTVAPSSYNEQSTNQIYLQKGLHIFQNHTVHVSHLPAHPPTQTLIFAPTSVTVPSNAFKLDITNTAA